MVHMVIHTCSPPSFTIRHMAKFQHHHVEQQLQNIPEKVVAGHVNVASTIPGPDAKPAKINHCARRASKH